MPIDPVIREQMEQDIASNFSPKISLVDNDGAAIVFDSVVAHAKQLNLDEILKPDSNLVAINIEYSSADQPFVRTCSDYMGEKRTPYISGTIPQTEYAGFHLVQYPTPLSLPITLSERRIQKLGFYISNPTGNTSQLRIQIMNEYGKVVWARIFYNGELGLEQFHWLEFPVGVTLPSSNVTLIFEEFISGDTPLGIRIGRDNIGNPISRFYACTVGRYIGKINISTIRFQVVAKPKQKGREPSPNKYVGTDDILLQIAKKLREHIWSIWNKFSLNDVRPIIYNPDSGNIYYWQSLFFDVAVITKDFGSAPEQKYTLEELDIQVTTR